MTEPLSYSAQRRFLPASFQSLAQLSRDASFGQWINALQDCGFILDVERLTERPPLYSRSGPLWPEDLDPLGPPPPIQQHEQSRRHALMHHPDGFVITLASGAGSFDDQGQPSEARRPLNELVIHHQTNLGASISDLRRGAFGSGGTASQGDGTRVYTGFERMHSEPDKLIYFLAECHHEARPTPLAQWAPSRIHIEHALFSSTPKEAALGGDAHREARERFAERLERDWRDFLAALPPEIAPRVGGTGVPYGSPNPREIPFLHASSVCDYWASQLASAGRNWPSDSESAAMRAWSLGVDSARQDKSGCAPLALPMPHERPLGATPLHAVSSFRVHPSDAPAVVDYVRRFLDAHDEAQLLEWAQARDARGRTPAGVAFEAWMIDLGIERAHDAPPTPRVIDLFLERGWVGAPGEFAQIAHDTLSPPPARVGPKTVPATLAHALAFDRVEVAARRFGQEWLFPLRCESGLAATSGAAIEALSAKFGDATGPTRAYLEALSLRSDIRPAPALAAAGPRL